MTAGLAIQGTVNHHPVAPWAGVGVTAAWAAAAMLASALLLGLREA